MVKETRDTSIPEATKISLREKESWKEPICEGFDFEIRRTMGKFGVDLIRRGRNLTYSGERTSRPGEPWKADIIHVVGTRRLSKYVNLSIRLLLVA